MSGHRVEYSLECELVRAKLVCHEPPVAVCRMTCENPAHEEGCPLGQPECPLVPMGDCNYVLWINGNDPLEDYAGPDDVALTAELLDRDVVFEWDGDRYTWRYAEAGR
jgi:hypothetical protein